MNKKGQALVEFVLVFPIFLMIIMTIIELGSVNYEKYKLENNLEIIVDMYNHSDENVYNYASKNDLNLDIDVKDQKTTISLNKNIKIVTPVLKKIYKNNYKLTTERVIYDE